MIRDTLKLAAACERFAKASFITVDTEFLRESTFWPKLCIVQIADEEGVEIIDALAPDIDLAPLFGLLKNKDVLKVFHSGRQDIEIFWHLGRTIPEPLADTQIAAMALGYGESVSYEQLVQSITGNQVDKSSRFTDWSKRPLSEGQLAYAAADVTHLRTVYAHLSAQLADKNRESWIARDLAILSAPETYMQKPEDAWKKLRARIKKPRDLVCLQAVAAWREEEAQNRNIPRGRVMKDDQLVDVALRHPASAEALAQLRGMPHGFERSASAKELLAAIKQAMAVPQSDLPRIEKTRSLPTSAAATMELLRVLLKLVAEKHGVAPRILASSDDLENIATRPAEAVANMEAWQQEIFGKPALALSQGKLAFTLKNNAIVILPL